MTTDEKLDLLLENQSQLRDAILDLTRCTRTMASCINDLMDLTDPTVAEDPMGAELDDLTLYCWAEAALWDRQERLAQAHQAARRRNGTIGPPDNGTMGPKSKT